MGISVLDGQKFSTQLKISKTVNVVKAKLSDSSNEPQVSP